MSITLQNSYIILGATSGIARALSDRLAEHGHDLVLAARNREELDRTAADLRLRHQRTIETVDFDALAFDSHDEVFKQCVELTGESLRGVVLCHGVLIDQDDAYQHPEQARKMIDVNFTSAVTLLDRFARHFESVKGPAGSKPMITAIGSVAGDRGRQSNFIYGSTKAGLDVYLDGLRHRLSSKKIPVVNIKPGFVDTAMTHGKVDPKSPMVASPQRVAKDIHKAMKKGKPVVYTPWFWGGIMAIVRNIPRSIFHKTKM